MQGLQAGSHPLLTQDPFHLLPVQTEVRNSTHRNNARAHNIYNLNVKFTRTRRCAGPHHLGAAAHASCISPAARLLVCVLDQLRVRPLDDDGDGGQHMKTEGTRHVLASTVAGMLAAHRAGRRTPRPRVPGPRASRRQTEKSARRTVG